MNPCAVKGISIFLALADAFPRTAFAAVPTWGTTAQDYAALRARANITLLDPVDDIDLLLRRRVCCWCHRCGPKRGRGLCSKRMLRGVPVMAADVGGIPEAKMGVPYLLPVNPIAKYQTQLDEQMVPVAEVPPQNIEPWREALDRLLHDEAHFDEISRQSREAAMHYASTLDGASHSRIMLKGVLAKPATARLTAAAPASSALSADKRRLLALRLRKKAPAASWFPGADARGRRAPFLLSARRRRHRGLLRLARSTVCPVRLPGRESRAGGGSVRAHGRR